MSPPTSEGPFPFMRKQSAHIPHSHRPSTRPRSFHTSPSTSPSTHLCHPSNHTYHPPAALPPTPSSGAANPPPSTHFPAAAVPSAAPAPLLAAAEVPHTRPHCIPRAVHPGHIHPFHAAPPLTTTGTVTTSVRGSPITLVLVRRGGRVGRARHIHLPYATPVFRMSQ
ncbi:hypothetical protein BD779DRAFT_236553 [Infundibulicybe gibba]|nr:hypothetical protein BD779DRAFT_236553 [Infundibulicybe gibba]